MTIDEVVVKVLADAAKYYKSMKALTDWTLKTLVSIPKAVITAVDLSIKTIAKIPAAVRNVTSTIVSIVTGTIQILRPLIPALRAAGHALFLGFQDAWINARIILGSMWVDLMRITRPLRRAIWGFIGPTVMAALAGLKAAWAGFLAGMSALWFNTIIPMARGLLRVIVPVINALVKVLAAAVIAIGVPLAALAGLIVGIFRNVIIPGVQAVLQLLIPIVSRIITALTPIVSKIASIFVTAFQYVIFHMKLIGTFVFLPILTGFRQAFGHIMTGLRNSMAVFRTFLPYITAWMSKVWGAISSVATPVFKFLGKTVSTIVASVLALGAALATALASGLVAGAVGILAMGITAAAVAMGTFVAVTIGASIAVVQLGLNFEKARTSFEVMTGSAAKGQKLLQDIRDLAVKTPYTSTELRPLGEMLMGFGVSSEKIVPILSRIGDIAAGDTNKFKRLALAFGQVVAAGRFMGTELRQFTEAGVGAADFAAALGISTAEFRDRMRAGLISSEDMVRGINRMTDAGGRFYQMNQRINQTVGGSWSAFVERLQMFGEDLGLAIFQKFDIADWIQRAANSIKSLDGTFIVNWLERAYGFAQTLAASFLSLVDYAAAFVGHMASINVEDMSSGFENMIRTLLIGFAEISTMIAKVVTDISIMILEMKEYFQDSEAEKAVTDMSAWERSWLINNPFGDRSEQMAMKTILLSEGEEGLQEFLDKRHVQKMKAASPEMKALLETRNRLNSLNSGQNMASMFDTRVNQLKMTRAEQVAKNFGKLGIHFADMFGPLTGFGARMALGLPPAAANPKIDTGLSHPLMGEAQRLANDVKDSIREGVTPMDKYRKTQELLNLGLYGPGGMGAWAMGMKVPGIMDETQWGVGALRSFEELAGTVKDVSDRLPPTAFAGSSEAMDIINQSMANQETAQDRVLRVMEEAARTAERQAEHQKETVDTLRSIRDKLIQPKGGKI